MLLKLVNFQKSESPLTSHLFKTFSLKIVYRNQWNQKSEYVIVN